jgi:hypothetical protein
MVMGFLRSVLVGCAAVALLGATVSAETTVFVVPNFDGYGIDECLADGRPCGKAAAAAWCLSRDYAAVADFGRLDRAETTASVPVAQLAQDSPRCGGHACSDQVAITCVR